MQQLSKAIYLSLYQDIVDFRNTFQLPVNDPANFSNNDSLLHQELYLEEYTEIAQADTQVKRADGIVDTIYVLMGCLVQLGYRDIAVARANAPQQIYIIESLLTVFETLMPTDVFKPCWDNIHASNLSKVCSSEADKRKTLAHYKKLGVSAYAEKNGSVFLIKVKEDCQIEDKKYPKGKVLKSVSYTPANLEPLV